MENFSNYAEMRRKVSELFQDGKFDQAAAILEWGLRQYPENLLANAYNLGACYAFLEQPENAIRALGYGLDRGIWYGKWDL
jgi:tetratricopeptide (TPR) repeat protein